MVWAKEIDAYRRFCLQILLLGYQNWSRWNAEGEYLLGCFGWRDNASKIAPHSDLVRHHLQLFSISRHLNHRISEPKGILRYVSLKRSQ